MIAMHSTSAIRTFITTNHSLLALIVTIVIAITLRLGVAFYLGNSIVETRGGTYDQISYDALSQRLIDGHGFSFATNHWPYASAEQPTAFWSYLYTFYLAGVYKIFGHQPLIARLVQAVITGILTPWLTFRIAKRVFDKRVAIVSAAIAAIYAYFVYYGASLMTESLYIVGVLWCIDAAMRAAELTRDETEKQRRSGRSAIIWAGLELGVALGVTLLLRQTFLFIVAVMFAWLVWVAWRRGGLRSTAGIVFLAGVVMVLLLTPFIFRNYRTFGRFTMPNTNAGFAFFWSNHPVYGTQFEAVLSETFSVSYQELIPHELRDLNEAELDRALLARGLELVVEDPIRYVWLSLSRIPVFFLFWPTSTSSTLSNLARVFSFGLFLPLMIIGLVLAVRNLTSRCAEMARDLSCEDMMLLLLFAVVYTAVHLASWANVRYRLPVDAVLIVFAAYAIERIYARWFASKLPSS